MIQQVKIAKKILILKTVVGKIMFWNIATDNQFLKMENLGTYSQTKKLKDLILLLKIIYKN